VPTIFAASESRLQLNGEEIEGVRAIDYRHSRARANVYSIGQTERIGVVSGPQFVEGRVIVASTSPAFDAVGGELFQLTALLRHGETSYTVTFDDCFLSENSFEMELGGHGESVYRFTAARVRLAPEAG
jgi:hypothetical protein